jgi:hypothetical protein
MALEHLVKGQTLTCQPVPASPAAARCPIAMAGR